jgi:hypothetical protein
MSQVALDVDEILHGLAQLDMDEFEQFVDRALALQAHRRAQCLLRDEAELLQKINQRVPPEARNRYDELNAKLHEETITPTEHQELLALNDQIELIGVERMKHLIELAHIRNVSVDALMSQLGIRPSVYA